MQCLAQLGPYPARGSRPNWELEMWNTQHFGVRKPHGTTETRNLRLPFEWHKVKSANPSGVHGVTPAQNLIYFMKVVKKISHYISFSLLIQSSNAQKSFLPHGLRFPFKADWMTGHNRRWRPVTIHFWSWQAWVECFANVQAPEAEMPDPKRG